MPRRFAFCTVVLSGLIAVAGCGGDDSGSKTVTVTAPQQPAAQQQTQTQQTTSEATVPDFTVPTEKTPAPAVTTPEPSSSGGSLASAEATVAGAGYVPDDTSEYHAGQTLRVLVATRKDSGDGYAKKAFFFVGGHYIGTDTSSDSAGIRVGSQGNSTIRLEYAIYGKNDPLCCPSSSASVRYYWNGSRLSPLDPIPAGRG